MSLLTGLLPVEQGVACLAALQSAATEGKTAGDTRSKGQIMVDTLVARLTGQEVARALIAQAGTRAWCGGWSPTRPGTLGSSWSTSTTAAAGSPAGSPS
jgi:hypothetical protein